MNQTENFKFGNRQESHSPLLWLPSVLVAGSLLTFLGLSFARYHRRIARKRRQTMDYLLIQSIMLRRRTLSPITMVSSMRVRVPNASMCVRSFSSFNQNSECINSSIDFPPLPPTQGTECIDILRCIDVNRVPSFGESEPESTYPYARRPARFNLAGIHNDESYEKYKDRRRQWGRSFSFDQQWFASKMRYTPKISDSVAASQIHDEYGKSQSWVVDEAQNDDGLLKSKEQIGTLHYKRKLLKMSKRWKVHPVQRKTSTNSTSSMQQSKEKNDTVDTNAPDITLSTKRKRFEKSAHVLRNVRSISLDNADVAKIEKPTIAKEIFTSSCPTVQSQLYSRFTHFDSDIMTLKTNGVQVENDLAISDTQPLSSTSIPMKPNTDFIKTSVGRKDGMALVRSNLNYSKNATLSQENNPISRASVLSLGFNFWYPLICLIQTRMDQMTAVVPSKYRQDEARHCTSTQCHVESGTISKTDGFRERKESTNDENCSGFTDSTSSDSQIFYQPSHSEDCCAVRFQSLPVKENDSSVDPCLNVSENIEVEEKTKINGSDAPENNESLT